VEEAFDSFGGFGQGTGEAFEGAVLFDVVVVFDADA
jgi:hypothetical protein